LAPLTITYYLSVQANAHIGWFNANILLTIVLIVVGAHRVAVRLYINRSNLYFVGAITTPVIAVTTAIMQLSKD
jgi:hypothetical protein